MAKKFKVDIDLLQHQLKNGVLDKLSSAPSSPVSGQVYYNTTSNKFHGYDGTSWIDLGASGGGVKELFFISIYNVFQGDYGSLEISTNGNDSFNFAVPLDFVSLVSLEVCATPENTNATANVDLNSDYSAAGESETTHSETDTAITFNFTADQKDLFDISSVFSSLAAGDHCGLNWKNSATGVVNIYGIRLRYNT